MTDPLASYAAGGHHEVDGWLTPIAVALLMHLAEAQKSLGIGGPVCEIGVHHGRLFILLHLLTAPGESSVAWDLFEQQEQNVDRSGRGDREALEENLDRFGCDRERIRLITANSLDLEPGDVIEACQGRPRIFSVDGGHTADATVNDLGIAAGAVCESGLIVLDDFFNEAWPGVADGTFRFLVERPGTIYPVVIAGNKFVFTNSEASAGEYLRALNDFPLYLPVDRQTMCKVSMTQFMGQPVAQVSTWPADLSKRIGHSRAWQAVRDKPVGSWIRKVKRRVSR